MGASSPVSLNAAVAVLCAWWSALVAANLAVIRQRGQRREVVLLDRLTGRLRPIPLPGDRVPERLSLAPDGQRLALQVLRQGQLDVELFRLPALEADRPAGAPLP